MADKSQLFTLGAVAVGGYILYNWAKTQCSTPGSSLYGGSICGMLSGTTATAASSQWPQTMAALATVPATILSAAGQAAFLAQLTAANGQSAAGISDAIALQALNAILANHSTCTGTWNPDTFGCSGAPAPPVSTPATVIPPPTSAPVETGNTTPAWMTSLSALAAQLQSMSGQSGNLNVDQWSYYYNQLREQRGMPDLTGAQVSAILALDPSGNRSDTISATQYVNDIFNLGQGLSGGIVGFGGNLFVPAYMIHNPGVF